MAALSVAGLTVAGEGHAQQAVNSATGVTLFPVGSVVRTHTIVRRLSAPDGSRDVRAVLMPVSLNYGLLRDLTLALNVPWIRKELVPQSPAGGPTTTASGIGDIRLLAKYRFFRADGFQKTLQLAALGGIKLPTGATDVRLPDGGFLPMPLQVGSGSADPLLGLSGTGIWDWRVAHLSFFYRPARRGGRDYRLGDLFDYNAVTNFRVWTRPYPGPELYLGAEINGEVRGRDDTAGVSVENSGSHRLFFSPTAVFFLFRNLTLESSLQFPVFQALNGTQLEDGPRFVFGLRFQYGLFLQR